MKLCLTRIQNYLPKNIISELETEEGVDNFFKEINNKKVQNSEKDREEEEQEIVNIINILQKIK